jgi:hypothetical protein
MTPQLEGALISLSITAVLAILGWIGNVIVKRIRVRASEPDMWKQLDKLSVEIYGNDKEPGLKRRLIAAEATAAAQGRILRDLSQQWVGPPPKLNPQDLVMLDATVLAADHPWRQKPPRH